MLLVRTPGWTLHDAHSIVPLMPLRRFLVGMLTLGVLIAPPPGPAFAQTECQFWEAPCTACPSSLWNQCGSFEDNPAGATFASQERGCGFLGCQALCNFDFGTACGDALPNNSCDAADFCDGSGSCLNNIEPAGTPCGSSSGTTCDLPDTCDGAQTCQRNHVQDGTPCGDPSSGECASPDSCAGGSCRSNNPASGSPCSGGLCESNSGMCEAPVSVGFILRGVLDQVQPGLSGSFSEGDPISTEIRFTWPAVDSDPNDDGEGDYRDALEALTVTVGSYTASWTGGQSAMDIDASTQEVRWIISAFLTGPEVEGFEVIMVRVEVHAQGPADVGVTDGLPGAPLPLGSGGGTFLDFTGSQFVEASRIDSWEIDACPYYTDPENIDTDHNGIGDACECGDQNGDGRVNVSDILAINEAIFEPSLATELCDTNEDDLCDVRDILGAQAKIFGAAAHCARYPSPGS